MRKPSRSSRRVGAATVCLAVLFAGIGTAASLIDAHFSLTRLDGKRVTEADFRGKWMLVYFGYTYCPDVCPTVLSQLGAALRAVGPRGDQFQPIFITLDPARDSAKVMTAYLKAFGPRFVGLRGNGLEIAEAAEHFHAYYRLRGLGNGQYTVDHSSYIYVIDPRGRFVELLTGDVPGHSLADTLRELAR